MYCAARNTFTAHDHEKRACCHCNRQFTVTSEGCHCKNKFVANSTMRQVVHSTLDLQHRRRRSRHQTLHRRGKIRNHADHLCHHRGQLHHAHQKTRTKQRSRCRVHITTDEKQTPPCCIRAYAIINVALVIKQTRQRTVSASS